jgi:hypothetical protein
VVLPHVQLTITSVDLPLGWYTLARQQGETRRHDPTRPKHTRLGLYCSIGCLERMLPRLAAEAEVRLGAGRVGPRQRRRQRA